MTGTDQTIPTSTTRSTRRRPPRSLLVWAVAALTLLAAACGDGDEVAAPASPPGAPGGERSAPPSVLEVTSVDHTFEASTAQLAAGPVTVRLVNEGDEPHQVHLARVPDGTTPDDFVEVFRQEGEAAAFESFEWRGGVSGVEPGVTAAATSVVPPGEYLLICFIQTPGEAGHHGTAHLELGMVEAIEVVATGTEEEPPEASTDIVLSDFAIEIPEGFSGGEVAVRNDGRENHELVLMRFDEGAGPPELIAWQEAGGPADRPFTFAGGTGTIAPGATAWTDLDLPPGDYIALCVVRGPADVPHVDMGMVSVFTVSA